MLKQKNDSKKKTTAKITTSLTVIFLCVVYDFLY